MSTESTASVSAPTQGANPVERIEARGEKEFASVLTSQDGDTKSTQNGDQSQAKPAAATPPPASSAAPAAAPTTEPTKPTPAGVDAATLEQIVTAAVAGARKGDTPAATPAPKEITAEDFNKKYGIPTVDATLMQRLMDADPAKGAAVMQNLLLQAVRSGALIAKDAFGSDLTKLRSEFEPDIQHYRNFRSEREQTALYDKFFTTYPDLKDERELVDALGTEFAARVKSGAIKISSPDEGMKLVADAVRKTVTRLRGTTAAAPGKGASSAPAAAPQREMSAASSAGRSGTGQPQQKSDVETVFGHDAR